MPSDRGNEPRNRHSRESGNTGGVEWGNTAWRPRQNPWIPAFAGMTEWPSVRRSGRFDTACQARIRYGALFAVASRARSFTFSTFPLGSLGSASTKRISLGRL